jgi:WD40 repeat protein
MARDLRDREQAAGRFDAFISYKREDAASVDWLQHELSARGKRAWVDRTDLEPASAWKDRAFRGILLSRAFIFVLTPESTQSSECKEELAEAVRQGKPIIPVLLRPVDPKECPAPLPAWNWIEAAQGKDCDGVVDEVISALETDVGWQDDHVRFTVRAEEWADHKRDRGYVLRGKELSDAEEWQKGAAGQPKREFTQELAEYIVESRKAATRIQRTWQAALSAGLAVSLALAAVALVQRNQAQTQARIANSRALAAEAVAGLPGDPARSIRLALEATRVNADAQSEQALRLTMAQDRLRMVINSGTGAAAQAAWNPVLPQIAVTVAHGGVALWNSNTGHVTQVLPTAGTRAPVQLLFNPAGTRLAAVSWDGFVTLWNISASGTAVPVPTAYLNEIVQSIEAFYPPPDPSKVGVPTAVGAWAVAYGDVFYLSGVGLTNVIQFTVSSGALQLLYSQPVTPDVGVAVPEPGGRGILVGGRIVAVPGSPWAQPSPPPIEPDSGLNCWLPDSSAVAVTQSIAARAEVQVYSALSGKQVGQIRMPSPPMGAVACSANPAGDWVAAGDASGNVILRLATGTLVPLAGHSDAITAIASSPDGRYLAAASDDGTARVWNASSGQLISVLSGGGGPVSGVSFGPDSQFALTVAQSGTVRVWDTGVGEPAAVLQATDVRQGWDDAIPVRFDSSGHQVLGVAVQESLGALSQVTTVAAVSWNAHTGRLARMIRLPGFAPAPAPWCVMALRYASRSTYLRMLSDKTCGIPPPPGLTLTIPVARSSLNTLDTTVLELLAVAQSPDGQYIAYGRSGSVAVLSADGHTVATLPTRGTPTGLAFTGAPGEVMVTTGTAIYLWRPLSGQPPTTIPQPSAPYDAALTPSGGELVAADAAGGVRVWNTANGSLIRTFTPVDANSKPDYSQIQQSYFPPTPLRVAVSPDGGVVASGNADGTVFLWNVATGRQIAVRLVSQPTGNVNAEPAGWPVTELSMPAGGTSLLAATYPQAGTGVSRPAAAILLDIKTGRQLAAYQAPSSPGLPINPGLALSPDGQYVFTGVLGLSPAPPGGAAAAYQVSSEAAMTNVQAAFNGVSFDSYSDYSTAPAQPWSPDDGYLIAGGNIYACDACLPLAQLQAAAATRIAWSAPLSTTSGHPPATSPLPLTRCQPMIRSVDRRSGHGPSCARTPFMPSATPHRPQSMAHPTSHSRPMAAGAHAELEKTLPHRNGRTEGVNTKTKKIKRDMSGRADFELLRHRILLGLGHLPSPPELRQNRCIYSPYAPLAPGASIAFHSPSSP